MVICGLLASRYAATASAASEFWFRTSIVFGALTDMVSVAGATFTLLAEGGSKSVQWAVRVGWPVALFGAAAALYYLKMKDSPVEPLLLATDFAAAMFIVMTLVVASIVAWPSWHYR
jgi:hypothetical protein